MSTRREEVTILSLLGFKLRPSADQPAACHYTDCATLAIYVFLLSLLAIKIT
jgi:hypothetical protein